jgi:hypothetical protein
MSNPQQSRIRVKGSLQTGAVQVARRLALLGLVAGLAAEAPSAEAWLPLELGGQGGGWLIRGGPRVLFNVKASMNPVAQPVTPGIYDDGFVLPDINGSTDGRTWYWGYEQDAQLTGQLLRLSRLSDVPAAGFYSDETGGGLSPGGEVVAGMKLAELSSGKHPLQFGLECGYGFNRFSFSHSGTASGTARLDAAAFDLGGSTAPLAPYSGTFQGPGPLINVSPSISGTLFSPAEATYSGDWESSLHNFKFGFWFTYPINRRFSTALSFGYSSVYADTQIAYQESISFQNPGFGDIPNSSRTTGGYRDWNPGVYAQLRLAYEFSPHVGIYAGGDFQTNDKFSFEEAGRAYELDLSAVFGVTLGLTYRF